MKEGEDLKIRGGAEEDEEDKKKSCFLEGAEILDLFSREYPYIGGQVDIQYLTIWIQPLDDTRGRFIKTS